MRRLETSTELQASESERGIQSLRAVFPTWEFSFARPEVEAATSSCIKGREVDVHACVKSQLIET